MTISDKKTGIASTSNSSLIDHYEADVVSAQDYYPFGMLMPGRRGYSSSTGWNSGSPGSTLPANPSYSSRTGNTPLVYKATQSIEFTPGFESGEGDAFEAYITQGDGGEGSELAGSGIYRYGFNGKENDDEVKGEGNQQDYGMRIYDPRLGKFLSVDPLTKDYPELTPYQFASNRPIDGIDLDGKEWAPPLKVDPKTGKHIVDGDAAIKIHTDKKNAVAVTIVVDVVLTKGWLTRTLLFSQGLGLLEHNRAKTPQAKAAQDARMKENGTDFLINVGSGYMLKRLITGVQLLSTRKLYNFGAKALGEMGEEAMARQYGTIKPAGKGSSLSTSEGPRKPDGIPIGTTIRSTDKLFESKVGFQNYSGDVVKQVSKDAELLSTGQVKEITWIFHRSPSTGKVGASDELLTELKKANIKTEIAGDIPKDIVDKAIIKYGATPKN